MVWMYYIYISKKVNIFWFRETSFYDKRMTLFPTSIITAKYCELCLLEVCKLLTEIAFLRRSHAPMFSSNCI